MKRSILFRTFVIVTAVTVLFFCAMFIVLYHVSFSAMKDEAVTSTSAKLEMIRTGLDSMMDSVNEYVYMFMNKNLFETDDTAQVQRYFEENTPLSSVITSRILIKDGNLIAMDTPIVLASIAIDSSFYQGMVQKGKLAVSPPYYSSVTAARTVSVVRSMMYGGSEYIFVCEMRTQNLFGTLLQKLTRNETLVILSSQGDTVYFSPSSGLMSNLVARDNLLDMNDEMRSTFISLSTGVHEVNILGKSMIVERLKYNQSWNLYYLVDVNQFYASANAMIHSFLIFAIPAGVLLIGVCMLLSAGITRPIKKLARQVDKLEPDGSRLALPITRKDEIGHLGVSFNNLMSRLDEVAYEKEKSENERFKMEYKVLQSQIQPHFLFNIHMCIDGLMEKKEYSKARQMLAALDTLLRESTDKTVNIIPLKEEMKLLEKYLLLQQMRTDESFKVKIGDWSMYENVMVPKLLLQPIAENAIQHGLSGITWQGSIEITFEKIEEQLHILIKDNGGGMEPETVEAIMAGKPLPGSQRGMVSIGLGNVRSRIRNLYGENCGLYVFSRKGLGTTVELVINLVLPLQ